ncbi:MAG: MauE/DoxX family redox-associated membrane protein [Planctomycetota bacterium]
MADNDVTTQPDTDHPLKTISLEVEQPIPTPRDDQPDNDCCQTEGSSPDAPRDNASPTAARGYAALATLVAYILLASFLGALPTVTLNDVMANFMGGFFIAFSFFKVLDLRGFVASFRRYDILAEKTPPYAWAYPGIELALGLAYLTRLWPVFIAIVTLLIMLVGTVGVARSLIRRDKIRCACLGTVINLPLGTVTLIENLGMAAMAAAMLWMRFVPEATTTPTDLSFAG